MAFWSNIELGTMVACQTEISQIILKFSSSHYAELTSDYGDNCGSIWLKEYFWGNLPYIFQHSIPLTQQNKIFQDL